MNHPTQHTDPFDIGPGRTWTIEGNLPDFRWRLHNGDPTYGWVGDPELDVYYRDTPGGREWALFVFLESGPCAGDSCRVTLFPVGHKPVASDLRRLAERRIGVVDIVGATEAHQAATRRDALEQIDRIVAQSSADLKRILSGPERQHFAMGVRS